MTPNGSGGQSAAGLGATDLDRPRASRAASWKPAPRRGPADSAGGLRLAHDPSGVEGPKKVRSTPCEVVSNSMTFFRPVRSMPGPDGSCRFRPPRTPARPRHRLTCHHLLDQATERRARTRARPAWPWRRLAAGSGGGGSGPGPRSSRRPRSRTRLAPAARPQTGAGTSRARPRLGGEVSGTGKDPRTVPPRLEGVLVQPAPDGTDTQLLHQPAGDGLLAHVSNADAAQRDRPQHGQLTGDRLDLSDDRRGERPAAGPAGPGQPGPPGPPGRSACATSMRCSARCPGTRRSACSPHPARLQVRSEPAAPPAARPCVGADVPPAIAAGFARREQRRGLFLGLLVPPAGRASPGTPGRSSGQPPVTLAWSPRTGSGRG
jgi:hypothetical protein